MIRVILYIVGLFLTRLSIAGDQSGMGFFVTFADDGSGTLSVRGLNISNYPSLEVILEGVGALALTTLTSEEIQAAIPSGLSPGIYHVLVASERETTLKGEIEIPVDQGVHNEQEGQISCSVTQSFGSAQISCSNGIKGTVAFQ